MKYTFEQLAKMIDHSLLHPTMTDKVVNDTSGFFHKVGQLAEQGGEKNGEPATAPAKTPAAPSKGDGFDGGWLLSPSKPAGGNR